MLHSCRSPNKPGRCSAAWVALALLIACGGCSGPRAPQTAKRVAPPKPKSHLQVGGREVGLGWKDQAGRPVLIVQAKSLDADEATQRVTMKAARCRMYRNGRLAAVLTAPVVKGDGGKRTLAASGGVAVKSADGRSCVRADSVTWDANRHIIRGRGHVVVRWRGAQLSGDELGADTGLAKAEIMSKTNGEGRFR